MQLNSDVGIRQYAQAQTVQNAKTTTATANVAAQKEGTESVAAKTTSPDLDKAEFSSTRDVMKMSDSERASLVSSLKEDLDNQMNRFTSMMMQTFNKQGITSGRKDKSGSAGGYFRGWLLGRKADFSKNF